jgi:hypothetical protein
LGARDFFRYFKELFTAQTRRGGIPVTSTGMIAKAGGAQPEDVAAIAPCHDAANHIKISLYLDWVVDG